MDLSFHHNSHPDLQLRIPSQLCGNDFDSLASQLLEARPGTVVVLHGATDALFCSGLNMDAAIRSDHQAIKKGLQSYADFVVALRSAPVVTLAFVEGSAYGGGVGVAAACDYVLASRDARLGLPEALLGLYPAMVFAILEDRIPKQRARLLGLLAESVTADQALALGLVDEVADPQDMASRLARQVRRLRRAAPSAVAAIKAHTPHLEPLKRSLASGVEATGELLRQPQVQQLIESLHNKL
jgi:enoyl-CoA hydratase